MIEFFVDRKRTALAFLLVLIVAGIFGRINIPVEAEPDITIPVVYAGVGLPGVSPSDSERLLVRPLEEELRSIEGVKKLQAFGFEGYAAAVVEFEAAETMSKSLDSVRDAVNEAKSKFPDDAKEPIVREVSLSDDPSIIVAISSDIAQERDLLNIMRDIKNEIELLPEIFEVDLIGNRDEQLEAILNRNQIENYNISLYEIIRAINNNNQAVMAGEIETGKGQFSVDVPGLFEDESEINSIPIRSSSNGVVLLSDISEVKRNFKERTFFASINQNQSICLGVKKARGANLISTINKVENIVEKYQSKISSDIRLGYVLNTKDTMLEQVNSLQGNIIMATMFVLIVAMITFGIRSSLIVGSGIPVSIIIAIFILYALGFTYNFMVIFGMLVALGMLIDGSIVVVELADRKMVEGYDKKTAFIYAAKRMFWPVTASAATTLAVFIPLFFWPGVSGQFMRVLPITIFIILTVALIYSLMIVPVIGSIFGKASEMSKKTVQSISSEHSYDLTKVEGVVGKYINFLSIVLKRPLLISGSIIAFSFIVISTYSSVGQGVVLVSQSDPFAGYGKIQARGNLTIEQIDELSESVEEIVYNTKGIKNLFLQTGRFNNFRTGGSSSDDTIASFFFEFTDRKERENGRVVIENMRKELDKIPGIKTEIKAQEGGPPTGKDIEIRVLGPSRDSTMNVAQEIKNYLSEIDGIVNLESTLPVPGVEWELFVDKPKAAKFGADIPTIGNSIGLITSGLTIGSYRPKDIDEELDIVLRYPKKERYIDELDNILINTESGLVPISNFVEKKPQQKVNYVRKFDSKHVTIIKADVSSGFTPESRLKLFEKWIKDQSIPANIDIEFGGDNEEQVNSLNFVTQAFIISIMLMAALLVTQFNNFYQMTIILSAVVLSTAGVMLGLLIFDQVFSALLTGIGIVSLAGIVVNNNIILIDSFNVISSKSNEDIRTRIIKACAQRLRPIFLTSLTTMLGLIPLALNYSIDPIAREIAYDSNASTSWAPLAQCIIYGISFSAILTLVLTPCLLVLPDHIKEIISKYRKPSFA